MIEHSFSIYHLEYFLAILVRIMGAMAFAPIFGSNVATRRVRIFLGIAVALAIFEIYPYKPLNYTTFLQYTVILLKELIIGLTMGFMSNITLTVINMAGQFIDREIGFSMVSDFDSNFNIETTITAEFYTSIVMVVMLCSNMHYFIISALADSFTLIPLGTAVIDTGTLYDTMLDYIVNYFLIGLRISLPIFIVMVLVNVVLGVLAKTAPQMNMFVVGFQIKIFTGFFTLFVTIGFIPAITEFVYNEMQDIVINVLKAFY